MVETEFGVSVQGIDVYTKATVPVMVSPEVIRDHGLALAQLVGSNKYDRGEKEPDGSVFVRTGDR
jgi:hypothetical protein